MVTHRSVQFRHSVSQLLPECMNDHAGGIVRIALASGAQQRGISAPKPQIVPDPLAKAEVEHDQFVLRHRDDLGLSSGEALRKAGQAVLERNRLNRDL